jgi:hypothetical protein
MDREERRRETAAYIRETSGRAAGTPPSVRAVVRVPVPKYWMYAGFLISIIFLWVERKFF